MATTAYGSNASPERKNNVLYWAIGAAVVLAIIAFFSMRTKTEHTPTAGAPGVMENTPANSGTTTRTTTEGTTGNSAAPVNTDHSAARSTTEGATANSAIPMGTDSKSGSSMNTETRSNSNNSNTGGKPTTEPPPADRK